MTLSTSQVANSIGTPASVTLFNQVNGTSMAFTIDDVAVTVAVFVQDKARDFLGKDLLVLLNGADCDGYEVLKDGDSISLLLQKVAAG